jgi:hypothetical protein
MANGPNPLAAQWHISTQPMATVPRVAACTAHAAHYRSGAATQRVRLPKRACGPRGWERSRPGACAVLACPRRQGGTTDRGALHHRQRRTPARTTTREPSVATSLTGNTAWLDGGTAAATWLPPTASSITTSGEWRG